MLPGYDISSMFKKPLQNSARHQKGDTIHLLGIPLRQKFASSFDCKSDAASTTGTLDLDVGWKCFWETNRRQMACHYLARSLWLRRPRASHESLPRDPLRRMYSPLQQGHLLPQYWRQVHLPSWHQARFAWSSDGKKPGMVCARRAFTCLISSTTTQRPEDIYGALSSYKQYLRQKNGVLQKNSSSQSEPSWLVNIDMVAGGFNGKSMAMQQQRQHKYYWRSFCRLCVANAAGPYTIVGTGIDSKQLGWRLRVP